MSGKFAVSASAFLITAVLTLSGFPTEAVHAYRICTFKGTVVDHGWRSMTVRSNGQCAEVNVGWRTRYIPNRRPCIGESVAVDFSLENGYMRATKVVSLSPLPPSAQCYPPAPPSNTVCRNVAEDEASTGSGPLGSTSSDTCPTPQSVCTTKPPSHVTDHAWSPGRSESLDMHRRSMRTGSSPGTGKEATRGVRDGKEATRQKPEKRTPSVPHKVVPPDEAQTPKEQMPASTGEEKRYETLTGEVVASSPKSLSIRVADEGEAAEVISVRVGLKTKFVPFRRPAVGEKVTVDYLREDGDRFGYTVKVVQ